MDVSLSLNAEEQTGLTQVLDIATKAGGLNVASVTLHFLNRLREAQKAASAPPSPPDDEPA